MVSIVDNLRRKLNCLLDRPPLNKDTNHDHSLQTFVQVVEQADWSKLGWHSSLHRLRYEYQLDLFPQDRKHSAVYTSVYHVPYMTHAQGYVRNRSKIPSIQDPKAVRPGFLHLITRPISYTETFKAGVHSISTSGEVTCSSKTNDGFGKDPPGSHQVLAPNTSKQTYDCMA